MSFIIDPAVNNGYPHIPDMPEIPSVFPEKPYSPYMHVIYSDRNGGYPTFASGEKLPSASMQKVYPHGVMVCMGNDVNDGYPCIPEISGLEINKISALYFGGKHISDIYYDNRHISAAYCNENEVFIIRYIKV